MREQGWGGGGEVAEVGEEVLGCPVGWWPPAQAGGGVGSGEGGAWVGGRLAGGGMKEPPGLGRRGEVGEEG